MLSDIDLLKELEKERKFNAKLREIIEKDSFKHKDEIIYIAASKEDAKNNMYKVGGIKSKKHIKSRLSSYNTGRHSLDLKMYFCIMINVNNYIQVEARIKEILGKYKPDRRKEMYNLPYEELESYVKIICENCNSETDFDNEKYKVVLDKMRNEDPPKLPDIFDKKIFTKCPLNKFEFDRNSKKIKVSCL
jgi:hypothetical protein